jgi:proteasome lid subunit RPN8/RPN11
MGDTETGAGLSTALFTWSTAECPFHIDYSPRAFDDIRLAVMDAFFSLPRGGAEIGGILCGKWDGERLSITDYAALDCEHAFGPSFALSPRDEAQLAALITGSAGNGLRLVGWYHSHTRTEILLSDADQEIHRRFFPEPWQVALVLKPHTFHPTRAGIFFRDARGGLHGEASYGEFELTPLAVKPAPSGAPGKVEPESLPEGVSRPISFSQSDAKPPPPAPAPSSPNLPDVATRSSRSRWPLVIAAVLLGAAAYWKRDLWLPHVMAMAQVSAPAPVLPPPLGLNTIDSEGQLQIRWDRNSPLVQQATGGVLSIGAGGPSRQEIPLDKAHLLSGVFTFARQTEHVDVSLELKQPDGRSPREVTTFVGKLPEAKPAEDPAVLEQRDNLAKQVAKMQTDLDAQDARNSKLQKSVDQLSKQLRNQQRGRLINQIPK